MKSSGRGKPPSGSAAACIALRHRDRLTVAFRSDGLLQPCNHSGPLETRRHSRWAEIVNAEFKYKPDAAYLGRCRSSSAWSGIGRG